MLRTAPSLPYEGLTLGSDLTRFEDPPWRTSRSHLPFRWAHESPRLRAEPDGHCARRDGSGRLAAGLQDLRPGHRILPLFTAFMIDLPEEPGLPGEIPQPQLASLMVTSPPPLCTVTLFLASGSEAGSLMSPHWESELRKTYEPWGRTIVISPPFELTCRFAGALAQVTVMSPPLDSTL